MKRRYISPRKAVLVGVALVNIPVLILILSSISAGMYAIVKFSLPWWVAAGTVPLGIGIGWLWWSVSVPRWRLWALQHVRDVVSLYSRAIRAGVIWEPGHFFERTEIKTARHTLMEYDLELKRLMYIFLQLNRGEKLECRQARNVVREFLRQQDLSFANTRKRIFWAERLLMPMESLYNSLSESKDDSALTIISGLLISRLRSYKEFVERHPEER